MVSLRERKARPSYSDIPEGLPDLSESVEDDIAEVAGSAGSVPIEHGDAPLSSGASSEFQPDEGDVVDNVRVAGEDEEMAEVDESEPEVVTSDPEVSVTPAQEVEIKAPSRPPAPAVVRKVGTSTYTGPGVLKLPAAYRALIKESATRLTKVSPSQAQSAGMKGRKAEKHRLQGSSVYPEGPVTPFGTRLKSAPRGRALAEVEVVGEPEDPNERRDKRQRRAYHVGRFVPLLSPWEVWEGEGWWPEMWDGGGGGNVKGKRAANTKSKGKEKEKENAREGWKMREEVRIGLEGVGRFRLEELELFSDSEAGVFLPIPMSVHGKPQTTYHLGPYGSQKPVDLKVFDSLLNNDFNPLKKGFTCSAGGPVWGLDWCPYPESRAADFDFTQYLAVSTLPHIDTRPAMGERWPACSPGGIQIWSMTPASDDGTDPGGMRCEIVLCVDGGPAMEIKWMPLGAWDEYAVQSLDGSALPKLGILAAAQLDGSVAFYPVPHPRILRQLQSDMAETPDRPLFLRLRQPLLKLHIPDAMSTSFDWMTGTRIAVALSNGETSFTGCGDTSNRMCIGHCAVWDVGEALRSGDGEDLLPAAYFTVAISCIRSVVAGRSPLSDSRGRPRFGDDSSFLVFGSYDGTTTMIDLRDPAFPIELNRARTTVLTVGWAPQLASPMYPDVDYTVSMQKIRGESLGRGYVLAAHRGPVWSITTSEYHTMAVSGSTDGAVILCNYQTGFRRRRKAPLMYQRLFEVDYDSHTGEYRIVDNFLPETMTLEDAANRNIAKKPKKANDPAIVKTPNWSPHVAVHRVAWHNGGGIGRAGLLASGMASGLVRVDVVEGRFVSGMDPAGWLD